ncbi:YbaB/EbfC family nucleoid-associated protein [Micromonospora peucetia]|uniref:YbaB/EbfC DNA-binding family protein n=1 Tax=Micromonospora peucetia TaxID=47871 RepID=A0A1C6W2X4_9ACTN|nr:YbaB/EbfC family nucleoid-associated protein [Micromonospora peucetia]SCL72888.1 hypothetical protein GA0070608_5233 [Micromonospora peucetia]
MWADAAALDAAARRVDDWEAAFADRARRTRSLTSRIQALTGTARSPDRMVEATVDSSGQLVALRLDERTRQHSATHTSEQIVATARAERFHVSELRDGQPYPTTRHEVDAFEDRAYAHEERWWTDHPVRPERAL